MRRVMSLREYRLNEMEEDSLPFGIDESILDELVELVGSEEEIEEAAEEAYNDLAEAVDSGEIEVTETDIPENLAMAALILKLVESGKLNLDDADGLMEKYLG